MDEDVIQIIRRVLEQRNIKYISGKIWTTDAPYRETREKMKRRREAGCIAVDMECSALAAFSRMREIRYGQFVYAADNLDADEWQQRGLTVRPASQKAEIFQIALECACLL